MSELWTRHISLCLACTLSRGSSLLTQVHAYSPHTFFSFRPFSCLLFPTPTLSIVASAEVIQHGMTDRPTAIDTGQRQRRGRQDTWEESFPGAGESTSGKENRKEVSRSLMPGLNRACWGWHAFKRERKKKREGETKRE